MQALNLDGRKHDVFVRWPDGTISRPILLAAQDLFSGKIVGYRIDRTENKDQVRLTLLDVFDQYGIPEGIYFDNGHAFANKWLTGRTVTRFRFKIRDEDPVGLIELVGSSIHFVKPAHGQSKPIERAFRDLAEDIDRHPAFEGAYCGNNPTAKPENYGEKSVDLATFEEIVRGQIAEHNSRPGRRTKVCQGKRSFDHVFNEAYAQTPIRKLCGAQRRLFLLAAEGVTCQKPRGEIRLHDNRYWHESLLNHIGKKVVVRFDPQNLHAGIVAETLDGKPIADVPCIADVGFNDTREAREHARARNRWMKAKKEQAKAEKTMTAAQVAASLPKPELGDPPEANVIKPIFPEAAKRSGPSKAEREQLAQEVHEKLFAAYQAEQRQRAG